jgi:hypothetical protein
VQFGGACVGASHAVVRCMVYVMCDAHGTWRVLYVKCAALLPMASVFLPGTPPPCNRLLPTG